MEQEVSVIRHLIALHNCSQKYLPMNDSLIAYELILFLATIYEDKKSITPKQLFSSLPHSYSAMRHHYNRLLHDGYVVHESAEFDRRVKYIKPTEKFVTCLNIYTDTSKSILNVLK